MSNPNRVADLYLGVSKSASTLKTAGEVRFIKDRSGDKGEWGWGPPGPSERQIDTEFVFNPRHIKPLALVLRSTLMALGHATSAHSRFVKVKSCNVSPDGALGGRGYIQKIPDMRRQLMNVVEALSAVSDTLYDEMHAPHWSPQADTLNPRDREEVKEIVEDVKEIKEDPEAWAEEEEAEMDADSNGKKASLSKSASRHARVYVERDRDSGYWGVWVEEGRRSLNVTDDVYRTERAAQREADIIRAQVAAGMTAEQIGSAIWSSRRVAHTYLSRRST